MALIFPGRQLANQKLDALAKKINHLGITPQLTIILIGSDPASRLYVKIKQRTAQKIGASIQVKHFPPTVPATLILRSIRVANQNSHIHGLMIQLPLPKKLKNHQPSILSHLDPRKDVDCLTPQNLGRIVLTNPRFLPATAQAVLTALDHACSSLNKKTPSCQLSRFLSGKRIALIGAGLESGKPLANLLSHLGATIIWVKSTEKNLAQLTRLADILITAVGHPQLITADMIKPGVIAIDVGTSPNPQSKKITGDLDFNSVKTQASFITPVPGGIGPLTVASLLENLVKAATKTSRNNTAP